jgi:hypothetical protein
MEQMHLAKKISPLDEKKMQILQSRIMKIYDKLHATRQTQENSGQVNVIPIYGNLSKQSGDSVQGHDSDTQDIPIEKKD